MTQFPSFPSRPLRDLRAVLQTQSPLDPAALDALADAMDVVEAREQALHALLTECYGLIYADMIFSDHPEQHRNANLAERVMAAICGRPAEQFRKVDASEVIGLPQAVHTHQEHAHA